MKTARHSRTDTSASAVAGRRHAGVMRRAAAAVVVASIPWLMSGAPAFAGVAMGATPSFPSSVTVGQSGLPAMLQVTNQSTSPESGGNTTLTSIDLVPACGTASFVGSGDCPAASADPGVFGLSSTATGEAGTACAGMTFTISVIDASTGQVAFNPTGGPVVLTPPGTATAKCTIDFTLHALKEPTHPTAMINANTFQTAQIGYVSGTSSVSGATGNGSGSSVTNVLKAAPGVTTSATPNGAVGSPISDTATLSPASPAGATPTGTITFALFGPNPASCSGTATFTSTVPVNGTGNYSSGPFTPTAPGTYLWIAAYSGDANNTAATTACGDSNETTQVSGATADMSISLGATPDQVTSGSQLTYTVYIKDYGPSSATGIKVTDVLPPSARFVSVSAPGWTCTLPAVNATGALTCSLNSGLPNTGHSSFTFVVKIVAAAPATAYDTATVRSGVNDPDTDNNSATISTDVR